jgi:hypothetical protein
MSEFVYWILIGGLGYLYLLKGNWRKREIWSSETPSGTDNSQTPGLSVSASRVTSAVGSRTEITDLIKQTENLFVVSHQPNHALSAYILSFCFVAPTLG